MLRDPYVGLADPTRREILSLLHHRGTRPAGDIAAAFSHLSRPAVSRHLRILRECELVRVSKQGKSQNYSLNQAPLRDVQAWITSFASQQVESLANLRQIVEADGD